jgi:7-cyano-7-deazaguanine synthase
VKTLVLTSGGLDSTVMVYHALSLHDEVTMLFFDYGQPALPREKAAFYKILGSLGIGGQLVELPQLGGKIGRVSGANQGATLLANYVPNRNAILLSHAFGIAYEQGFNRVGFATHAGFTGGYFPDTSPRFVERFQRLMDEALPGQYVAGSQGVAQAPSAQGEATADPAVRGRKTLWTPYLYEQRVAIVKRGIALNVPFDLTWSCYRDEATPCGTCGGCIDRQQALARVRMEA